MTSSTRKLQAVSLVLGASSLGSLAILSANYGEFPGLKHSVTDALSGASSRSAGLMATVALTACAAAWVLVSRMHRLPAPLGRVLISVACLTGLITVAYRLVLVASCLVDGMPGYLIAYHAFILFFSTLFLSTSVLVWTVYRQMAS